MEHSHREDADDQDDGESKGVLFLRARIIEVAREGDTSEMKYLMGISVANKLLAAREKGSGWSLLHFSCSRGYLEITVMLLEAGAKPLKLVDKHGKTCLHVAIEHGQSDVIHFLLERYPPEKWPRRSKLTLGQTAARAGRPPALKLLLQNGLNPNETGARGETPLHQAARYGHSEAVEILLQHGANVAAREAWAGRTPLHYACQSGSLKAAVVLIVKGGADAHLPDLSAAKHTPLEAAVVSGHRGISHSLVLVVETRQRAEQRRQAIAQGVAAASREAAMREIKMTRHRVFALRGKTAAKRSLVRMEKRELADTLQGQIARANARLRSLNSQYDRLRLREGAVSDAGATFNPAASRRPSTCPELSTTSGARESKGRAPNVRTWKGAATSDGVAEMGVPVNGIAGRERNPTKAFVRPVWGARDES